MGVIKQNLDTEFKAVILSLMPKHFHVHRQKKFPKNGDVLLSAAGFFFGSPRSVSYKFNRNVSD